MKDESFPNPGKPPQWWEDQPGWRGSFRASEESTANGLQRAKWRVTCTDNCYCCPELPNLRHSSTGEGRGWVLKLRLQRSDPGRSLGLTVGRQPEKAGV